MSDSLQALFRPNGLAVIGASAKPGKLGFTILKNILDAGFGGPVIPVNPKGETILGVPSVKSVDEIPSGTDLAVVIIPAASVPGAMLQLGERKVRAAIVITGGFAESGADGARLQEEVKRERSPVRNPGGRAELPGRELPAPRPLRVVAPHHPKGRHGHRVSERDRRGGPDRLGRRGEARLLGVREHGKQDRRGRGRPDRVLRRRSEHESDHAVHRRREGRREIPGRGPGVPEAHRGLQGRTDRARAQGRRVAHPVAGREGRDLRRRLPAIRHPPRRLPRGALRLLQGAGLCPGSRRAADAHRHELGRIGDHRHGRRCGQRVPDQPSPGSSGSAAAGGSAVPFHRREPARSHRGRRRRDASAMSSRPRGITTTSS